MSRAEEHDRPARERGDDRLRVLLAARERNRSLAVYDFTSESGGVTRVELTTYSEPATIFDRMKEIGAAGWLRRKTKRSLERLRMIFEEPPKEPLKRATIAGYEPTKAARFGAATGMDPARTGRD